MVTLSVNGDTHELAVGTDDTVVDVLRDRLRLTGTSSSAAGRLRRVHGTARRRAGGQLPAARGGRGRDG